MQSTSVEFKRLANADFRPIRADVFIDFRKNYIIGKPGDYDWDKYDYQNYSHRLINVEWSRERSEYSSLSLAMCDVILDNHDGFFTPEGSSILGSWILPNRPIKIYSGFGSEVIQSFVGLTYGMPVVNEKERNVVFHALDFLSYFMKKPLDESSMFVNKRTDEIIESLFNDLGILDSQMSLDKGFNIIPFAYTRKGEILGDVLFKLMEAEGGRLFMSEDGRITFKNRQSYDSNIKMYLSPYRNIVSSEPRGKEELINVVQIKGKIREVLSNQIVGKLSSPVLIPSGEEKEIWIEFENPITSMVDPAHITVASSSYYNENSNSDGSGSQSNVIDFVSSVLFGDSGKFVLSNSGGSPVWVTELVIFGTPAPVTQNFYIREEDSNSVDINGESILDIENDFFGSDDEAQSKAKIIMRELGSVGDVRKLEIKGDMSLQLDDCVEINLYGRVGSYRVIKIINKIGLPGKYTQLITLGRMIQFEEYFQIGVSGIGGSHLIAP